MLAISDALLGWSFGVPADVGGDPDVDRAVCLLAYALHLVTGADALATSPRGADPVAIIAATTKVDVPFVMAMQTGRFLLLLLSGPSAAKLVARWAVTD